METRSELKIFQNLARNSDNLINYTKIHGDGKHECAISGFPPHVQDTGDCASPDLLRYLISNKFTDKDKFLGRLQSI